MRHDSHRTGLLLAGAVLCCSLFGTPAGAGALGGGRRVVEGSDSYYRQAKAKGYRARSAFKLLELDEEYGLLENASKVVDLAAAPGSWSQVVIDRLTARGGSDVVVVAVDVQPMRELQGVKLVQGDITRAETADMIIALVGENACDVVLCDGAPDVTGIHVLDEYCSQGLVTSAMRLSSMLLRHGGTFVCKVLLEDPSEPFPRSLLFLQLKALFARVRLSKPSSSRESSHEHFVICKDFKPPQGYVPRLLFRGTEGLWGQMGALGGLLKCGSLKEISVSQQPGMPDNTATSAQAEAVHSSRDRISSSSSSSSSVHASTGTRAPAQAAAEAKVLSAAAGPVEDVAHNPAKVKIGALHGSEDDMRAKALAAAAATNVTPISRIAGTGASEAWRPPRAAAPKYPGGWPDAAVLREIFKAEQERGQSGSKPA